MCFLEDCLHRANIRPAYGPELDDITVGNTLELIAWAERLQYTPGVVHGERRRAAGIELIRRGIDVLRGRMSCPNDIGKFMREVPLDP